MPNPTFASPLLGAEEFEQLSRKFGPRLSPRVAETAIEPEPELVVKA